MGKFYTDAERLEFVKKWRRFGLPVKTFARGKRPEQGNIPGMVLPSA